MTAGRRTREAASIVVVTYNGLVYTKMCLASLMAEEWQPGDEIIIVDNASTDGTADYLEHVRRLNPMVRIRLNTRNCGFATANNQGLAMAAGRILVLLNNDTIVTGRWLDRLAEWLADPELGMVGPVTNRTCNEAQIDARYRTFAEMEAFAGAYTRTHSGRSRDLGMLAMFCAAMRRETFDRVGPLDEQFEVGMFEDDDYARRIRQQGYRLSCVDDVFVHHFGQGAFGELCRDGSYDRVFEANRHRLERKWGTSWTPHARRMTPEYIRLRERVLAGARSQIPAGGRVLVISKGDDEFLEFPASEGFHFPRNADGSAKYIYPDSGDDAISDLEFERARGAGFLLIPEPALWWLDFYAELARHLRCRYRVLHEDAESYLLFDLTRLEDAE